jgi:hypothetical protein
MKEILNVSSYFSFSSFQSEVGLPVAELMKDWFSYINR